MRLILALFFVSSFLYAMGERIDYSVDELSRISYKQRPTASASMFTRSIPHWKDTARLNSALSFDAPPTFNVGTIRKIKKLAVVDIDLGLRVVSIHNRPVDWKETDILAAQCMQAAGMALQLSGFSVVTISAVQQLMHTEPDWAPDVMVTGSTTVNIHGAGGAWMSWPLWLDKPLFAKDRAIHLMDALDVDGLVWISSRILLNRTSMQQAFFSAEPYSYVEWRQKEFEGKSTWTHLGVEMTVMTRKGLSTDQLIAWSDATKGDWVCPAILMNVNPSDPSKDMYEYRLSWSRYPILASFRLIMETMSARFKSDSTK